MMAVVVDMFGWRLAWWRVYNGFVTGLAGFVINHRTGGKRRVNKLE